MLAATTPPLVVTYRLMNNTSTSQEQQEQEKEGLQHDWRSRGDDDFDRQPSQTLSRLQSPRWLQTAAAIAGNDYTSGVPVVPDGRKQQHQQERARKATTGRANGSSSSHSTMPAPLEHHRTNHRQPAKSVGLVSLSSTARDFDGDRRAAERSAPTASGRGGGLDGKSTEPGPLLSLHPAGDVNGSPRSSSTPHEYGEEDFGFLRSLLQEVGDGSRSSSAQAHSYNAHNSPALREASVAYAPAAASAVAATTIPLPPLGLRTTSPAQSAFQKTAEGPYGSSPTYFAGDDVAASGRRSASQNAMLDKERKSVGAIATTDSAPRAVCEVSAAEKLQAADDVAACIWLADHSLREGLLARMRDTWGAAEVEAAADEAIAAAAERAATAAAALGVAQHQQREQVPRKRFREVLAKKLDATRKAVEAELKAADALSLATEGGTALCGPQPWRGRSALREDVLTRLKDFQMKNLDDPTFGPFARFSTFNCREGLLQRMQCNTAVDGGPAFSSITDIDEARSIPAEKELAGERPATSEPCDCPTGTSHHQDLVDDSVRVDEAGVRAENERMKRDMLERLQANQVIDNGIAGGRKSHGGNLRAGLLESLEATRAAAREELSKGRDGSASGSGGGASSSGQDDRDTERQWEETRRGGATTNAKDSGAGASKKRKRSGSGGRRCRHDGCTLHPHFGFTRPEYCSRHKLDGMFNVKGRRCVDPECTRTPVYGRAGDPHPTYCAAHKLVNMVDIKNPTCREPTCSRQPSFGSPKDRKATFCATHMTKGMVNVRRMLASKSSSDKALGSSAGKKGGSATKG